MRNRFRCIAVEDAQGGLCMTSDELRRKADQCLRLANGAVPNDVAEWLGRLAEEYEEEAIRLEAATLYSATAEADMPLA
jgi:hypothetical protein